MGRGHGPIWYAPDTLSLREDLCCRTNKQAASANSDVLTTAEAPHPVLQELVLVHDDHASSHFGLCHKLRQAKAWRNLNRSLDRCTILGRFAVAAASGHFSRTLETI